MELELPIGAGMLKVLRQEPAGSATSGIFIARGCGSFPKRRDGWQGSQASPCGIGARLSRSLRYGSVFLCVN